jgi:prevent-host-death family protein
MNVPTFEARNRLSELLAQVARGVEVTITKRGVPIAGLVPAAPIFDCEKARRAAAGLREASKGATFGGLKIKDLVEEGRS